MLTQEKLREFLDYCPLTGEFVWKVERRGGALLGQTAGYVNGDGYVLIGIEGKIYRAHRLAWFWIHGVWPSDELDHINCCKTDNRIGNLRIATRQANAENVQKARKHSASGILGVRKYRDRWRAEIRINGKQRQIGTFKTAEAAQEAYIEAKRAHHVGCMI